MGGAIAVQDEHISREVCRIHIPGSSIQDCPFIIYLGRSQWRLIEDYRFEYRRKKKDTTDTKITVPEDFTFDLASIPRAFWWATAPFELSIVAPLIHDFLYRYKGHPPDGQILPYRGYTRKESDRLFRKIMIREGVVPWRYKASYKAVRLLGGVAWEDGKPAKLARRSNSRKRKVAPRVTT